MALRDGPPSKDGVDCDGPPPKDGVGCDGGTARDYATSGGFLPFLFREPPPRCRFGYNRHPAARL
ncbi:MAG: hypothetical protein EXR72_00135 [Myxococcales bacterium]|nr:hypothetical protein [Myxococcales bacterium]